MYFMFHETYNWTIAKYVQTRFHILVAKNRKIPKEYAFETTAFKLREKYPQCDPSLTESSETADVYGKPFR